MENWSKRQKILFLLAAAWILWSTLRTLTDIEILGYSFWQWDQRPETLWKWVGPILTGWVLVICYDWVMKENNSLPPIVDPVSEKAKTEERNRLVQEIEKEIADWPKKQAEVAREIIQVTVKSHYGNFGRLESDLSLEQYTRVMETVKKLEDLKK